MSQGQNRPNVDEISTLNSARIFYQPCGPLPSSPVQFAGQDTQYMTVESASRPIRGGITPIRAPEPGRLGEFRNVGRSREAADFATMTMRFLEKHGTIPIQWGPQDQPANYYVYRGLCESLDDPTSIQDMVEVYSFAEAMTHDPGPRTPGWDNDDAAEDSIEYTVTGGIYALGSMGFQPRFSDLTNTEVMAVTYGQTRGCINCGINDPKGTNRLYAVTRPGVSSPGLLSEVIYTVNGTTGYQVSIDNKPATSVPLAIAVVGPYLVVLDDQSSYYYAPINVRTGTIGAFTRVTFGFTAGAPQDMVVLSPREVLLCGLSGSIYRIRDITAGPEVVSAGDATSQHLRRIKASGDAVLVCGDSGTLVFSPDRGRSFGLAPSAPSSWGFRAIEVLDPYRWWAGAGSGNGGLWYTTDGGYSWASVALESSNEVTDIAFATDEAGWVSYVTGAGTGRLLSTPNGGANWILSTNAAQRRMLNLPTHQRVNRIAVPAGPRVIAGNNVALAGATTGGTDGLIITGNDNIR